MRNIFRFISVFVIFFLFSSFVFAEDVKYSEVVPVRILDIESVSRKLSDKLEDVEGYRILAIQIVTARILDGAYKNVIHRFENTVTTNPHNISAKVGDTLIVILNEFDDGTFEIVLEDYYRVNRVIVLVVLLFTFFLFFIGKSAFRFFGSVMAFYGGSLFLLYGIVHQNFPLWLLLSSIFFITVLLIFLVYGFSREVIIIACSSIVGISTVFLSVVILNKIFIQEGFFTLMTMDFLEYEKVDLYKMFLVMVVSASSMFIVGVSKFMVASLHKVYEKFGNIGFFDFLVQALNVGRLKLLQYSLLLLSVITGSFFPLFVKSEFSVSTISFFNDELFLQLLIYYSSICIGMFIAGTASALFGLRFLYYKFADFKQEKLL